MNEMNLTTNTLEQENTTSPLGNGGNTDVYVWTQTLSEVNIIIPVPLGNRAKMFDVDFKGSRLKVGLKGSRPIVDGELYAGIIFDESLWFFEDGKISMTLQKENQKEWWKSVIIGDPEINILNLKPEALKSSNFEWETRQTVDKLIFDHRKKKITVDDEFEKQEMIIKFIQAHPEMDFSAARFSSFSYGSGI